MLTVKTPRWTKMEVITRPPNKKRSAKTVGILFSNILFFIFFDIHHNEDVGVGVRLVTFELDVGVKIGVCCGIVPGVGNGPFALPVPIVGKEGTMVGIAMFCERSEET